MLDEEDEDDDDEEEEEEEEAEGEGEEDPSDLWIASAVSSNRSAALNSCLHHPFSSQERRAKKISGSLKRRGNNRRQRGRR